MKNKVNSKYSRLIIIILILILIPLFVSSTNPFSGLTLNQKIVLAQAYYKVALYYYSHNNEEKGDAFKSVANYLDPNFVQKEISVIPEQLTDEEVEKKIAQAKENCSNFILDFFKSKDKRYLSYPVYNLKTADLFTEESIEALLNIEQIDYFFNNSFKIEKTDYTKAASLSSFLPLVYLEGDLIYILHDNNNEKIVVLLIRNFGIDLKIIGFFTITEKTIIK
jgi:hypothetical protein